jgi:hypothetical protein
VNYYESYIKCYINNTSIKVKCMSKEPNIEDMNYRASAYICEDFKDEDGNYQQIDIDISFGYFKTKEEAENIAENADVCIGTDSNKNKCITVLNYDKDGHLINCYYVNQEDCIFKKIKDSKKEKMGNTLNTRNKDTLEIIKSSLNPESEYFEKYSVGEDDMEEINFDLDYFVKHYADGKELQHIAYGYREIL